MNIQRLRQPRIGHRPGPVTADQSFRRICLATACVIGSAIGHPRLAAQELPQAQYEPARRLCELAEPTIHESSGLAVSRQHTGRFWTHNDSGDSARLFAFDARGRHLGAFHLVGVQADDWEDMGSFQAKGRGYLFVGDVGDNSLRRSSYQLHIFAEPEQPQGQNHVRQTLNFVYEDGPHDCEALALDLALREFLLVEKRLAFRSNVYRLPWSAAANSHRLVARRIASIPVPLVTSMDISPDGLRAVVATYGAAYEFGRGPQENWQTALKRRGRLLELPARAQGETICYGEDGVSLYLTSEKRPCPLFLLPARTTARD